MTYSKAVLVRTSLQVVGVWTSSTVAGVRTSSKEEWCRHLYGFKGKDTIHGFNIQQGDLLSGFGDTSELDISIAASSVLSLEWLYSAT